MKYKMKIIVAKHVIWPMDYIIEISIESCIQRVFVSLMVFKATLNNTSAISCGQFYWWRKPGDPRKTTDLSPVTDKHNGVHLVLIEIRTHNISDDKH